MVYWFDLFWVLGLVWVVDVVVKYVFSGCVCYVCFGMFFQKMKGGIGSCCVVVICEQFVIDYKEIFIYDCIWSYFDKCINVFVMGCGFLVF